MKTITVQQMPNGFEIEMPSLGYWVKAGVGFFFVPHNLPASQEFLPFPQPRCESVRSTQSMPRPISVSTPQK